MLRTATLSLILLATCLTAIARPHRHSHPFNLGIKAGISYQRMSGASIWEEQFATGPLGGAWAGIHRGKWHFRAEVLGKTTKVTYKVYSNDIKLTYIDIPLLAAYQVIPRVAIHAGPVYSYMAGARSLGTGSNMRSMFRRGDFSLAAGADVTVTQRFSVSARFQQGLRNQNGNDTVWPVTGNLKNAGLQLTAGFTLF